MADQRLEVLMKNTEPQYVSGSPLLLEANALYLDKFTNNCIVQLKWKNIDSRPIKAVMIEIDGYDTFDQKLEHVQYQYDGLLVTQGSEFGGKTPIMIKNSTVVKCDIILKAVSFSDDSVWRPKTDATLKPLPGSKPQAISGEMLDQFVRDLMKQGNKSAATYSPQVAMGLWQCGCGSWQYADTACLKCRITQKALSDISDESVLAQNLAKYKDEQEKIRIDSEKKAEEARIAREKAEAERKEKEEAERIIREKQRKEAETQALVAKKKKKTIGVIVAAVLIIAAGAVYAVTQIVIPGNHYSKAEAAFQNKQYVEAYEAFIQAGNYKDASEQAKKAAYSQAEVFLQQYDYDQAYSYFQLAQDYNDAEEQSNNAALLNAEKYQNQFDYESATTWYQKANSFEKATTAANMQYAVINERTWLHTDTREEKPVTLPENVFLFVTTTSSSKYSTTKEYGVLKVGEDGWITSKHNYSKVRYYPDHELILALTDSICTIIDLRNNTMHDVQNVTDIRSVSDDGIVCFSGVGGEYSWDNNGFFNRNGEIILPGEYEGLTSFSEGLSPVRKEGLYGYINTKGEVVIDFKYSDAEPFENGYAKVEMPEHKVKEGDMYVSYNEGWGLIDTAGNRIVEPNWDDVELYDDGFIRVDDFRKNGKEYVDFYGLFDTQGNVILRDIYTTIGHEKNGLRYVATLAENKTHYPNKTAGWVDSSGKMVINLISLGIDGSTGGANGAEFINGCALINHWYKSSMFADLCDAVVSIKGKVLWKGNNDDWSASQDSLGNIVISHRTWGNNRQNRYVDKETYYKTLDGEMIEISKPEWERLHEQSLEKDRAERPSWYYSDETERVDTSTPFYSQWASISEFSDEGIALVSLNKNGPYGYVSNKETIIVDAIYEQAKDFHNGYAAVKLNGKWGYIDTSGKTILEPSYLLASPVSDEKTIYVKNETGSYSLMYLDGKLIIDGIQTISEVDDSEETIAIPGNTVFIQLEGQSKWILVDAVGTQLF